MAMTESERTAYVAACLELDEQQFAERLQAEIARRERPVNPPRPSARKPLPRFRVQFWSTPNAPTSRRWGCGLWLNRRPLYGFDRSRPVAFLKALASPAVRALRQARWRYFPDPRCLQ